MKACNVILHIIETCYSCNLGIESLILTKWYRRFPNIYFRHLYEWTKINTCTKSKCDLLYFFTSPVKWKSPQISFCTERSWWLQWKNWNNSELLTLQLNYLHSALVTNHYHWSCLCFSALSHTRWMSRWYLKIITSLVAFLIRSFVNSIQVWSDGL